MIRRLGGCINSKAFKLWCGVLSPSANIGNGDQSLKAFLFGRKKMSKIAGVGVNDADYQVTHREGRKIVWVCPFYQVWRDLITRCYSVKCQDRNPTYRECTVVEDWHQFSNFRNWMQAQDWQGKELDKDLINPSNSVYGPKDCIFISAKLNTFIVESAAIRGNWPLGVCWAKDKGKFKASCRNPFIARKQEHIGYFDCPDQAHQAWKSRKLEHALTLASQQTDDRIAMALVARYC